MTSICQASSLVALSILGFLVLPGSGKAQNNADCRSFERDTGNSRLTERPADFFRHRQNLILGVPHVLKNGVAWRLVTDTPTGLALPRIVKMSDRAAIDKANRLLDAAHGCLLIAVHGWRAIGLALVRLAVLARRPAPYFSPIRLLSS
jgi:hypothetical protein